MQGPDKNTNTGAAFEKSVEDLFTAPEPQPAPQEEQDSTQGGSEQKSDD